MRILTLALIAFGTAAAAQPQIIVSQPPMVVGSNQASVLLTGSRVALRTVEPITTQGKKLKVGDRFNLEVSEAITLNGVTVIPVGSLAVGEITEVRYKGMFGKSGYVQGRVLYVRANNRQIRLTGRLDDKGANNGGAAGVATYATLVGGLFITGTSAVIPAGTMVTAYLDEDMPVTFASGVPSTQPMVVPTK